MTVTVVAVGLHPPPDLLGHLLGWVQDIPGLSALSIPGRPRWLASARSTLTSLCLFHQLDNSLLQGSELYIVEVLNAFNLECCKVIKRQISVIMRYLVTGMKEVADRVIQPTMSTPTLICQTSTTMARQIRQMQ